MTPRDDIALHVMELPGRGTASIYEAGLQHRGDAPTLALLHGSPGASLCSWQPTIARLASTFHIVAMDMRGHGRGIRPQSGFSATPLTLEDCADDLAECLAALRIGRAIVVGYSLGGAIAQLACKRHPNTVDGMVLVSTAMTFHSSPPHPLVLFMSHRDEAVGSIIGRGTRGKEERGAWYESRIRELVRTDVTAALQADAACGIFDASGWLPDIDVPTSIIITANDRVIPPSAQRAMGIALGSRNPRIVRSRLGHLAVPLGAPEMLRNIEGACIDVTQLNGRSFGAGRDLQ